MSQLAASGPAGTIGKHMIKYCLGKGLEAGERHVGEEKGLLPAVL